MKFKGSTKPLLGRYGVLKAAREEAFQAIFDAALPRRDIGWQDCYREHASDGERAAYDVADRAVFEFECAMREERRGWIENGRFNWYLVH